MVTVPQRNIQYYDWYGVGYLVLQPETGAAGYLISGGTAGGGMSVDVHTTKYYVEFLKDLWNGKN